MTVSSTTNRNNYTGNGATATYSYTFKVFDEGDLTVIVRDTDDVETTLAFGIDYTVTGVGVTAGGTIVLQETGQAYTDGSGNLETGFALTIRRVVDLKQETDIRNQGEFFAEVHEEAFDKVVMQNQQQQDEIDRAIKLSETQTGIDTTLPSPTAGYAIGWNGAGDALTNIASAGNLIVSPFGESLIDDANAAAARVTLDASQKFSSMNLESSPAIDDYIPMVDTSEGADNRISTEDLFKVVNEFSEETSTAAGDYALFYDASAGAPKKILTSNLVGSASGIELLQHQTELANMGFGTRELDNSVRVNGLEVPAHKYFTGYLIENYSSGASNIKVVWNPIVLNDSDKDYDAATNWTATGAGASLSATAGSNKVGSNKLQFDKNGTAVEAGIRYDRGSQNLAVGANYRVWVWLYLPSITNLSTVGLRMYADTTSNFRTWTTTINYNSAFISDPLAVGWNLLFFDLSNTSGTTTGGTGWTYSSLSRYAEVIVTTSSAGQTYSGILVDGVYFSHGDIAGLGTKYLEYTIYDTSNKNNMTISYNSTYQDGRVNVGLALQNYTAGISAAAAAKLVRSTMSWSQAGLVGFDTTLSSGAVALEQEFRITRKLAASITGANLTAYVDQFPYQLYKVTAVGGSTIDVSDSENNSANLVNGNELYIFTATNSMGQADFAYLATRSITGSSHSSGTTTITMTTSGIAVGDYVVKKTLTVSGCAVTDSTGGENFSTLSNTSSGIQLIGSRSYPNPNNVYAHFWLGGPSEALAMKDQTGKGNLSLTKIGSGVNSSDSFKSGKYSYSGVTTGTYFRTQAASAINLDGYDELAQVSFWFYFDAVTGGPSDRTLMAIYDDVGAYPRGSLLRINTGGSAVTLYRYDNTNTSSSTGSLTPGTWNHLVYQNQRTVVCKMWLNGVMTDCGTSANYPANCSGQAIYFGVGSGNSSGTVDASMNTPSPGLKLADAIFWRGGSQLSTSDISYLYNAGVPQWIGYNPAVLRTEWSLNSASGNRMSLRGRINRTTSAVSPYVLSGGILKT